MILDKKISFLWKNYKIQKNAFKIQKNNSKLLKIIFQVNLINIKNRFKKKNKNNRSSLNLSMTIKIRMKN